MNSLTSTDLRKCLHAELVEQPVNKIRFPYATEKKRGKVVGARSTLNRNTFVTLKIKGGYEGDAEVKISCVSHQPDSENRYA